MERPPRNAGQTAPDASISSPQQLEQELSGQRIPRPNRVKEWMADVSYSKPMLTSFYQEDFDEVASWANRWRLKSESESRRAFEYFATMYPDEQTVDLAWDNPADADFVSFFTWGHDHDFGHGYRRDGVMGQRHVEIVAHGIHLGMMPRDLSYQAVLNVGCWTGGDAMLLDEMGGRVHCLEEHPRSSQCAQALFKSYERDISVSQTSVFACDEDRRQSYDFIYCSGVLYHVTDPVLMLRILYAMLKPGGRIFVETKSCPPQQGAFCSYAGGFERGWNWFSPNEMTLFRMLADVGFEQGTVKVFRRANQRLLASACKSMHKPMQIQAGFSRPDGWMVR